MAIYLNNNKSSRNRNSSSSISCRLLLHQLVVVVFVVILIMALLQQQGTVVVVTATTFTFINNCEYTVWPGILSNAGVSQISTTGFSLQKGQSQSVTAPASWGGRFWARTHCTYSGDGDGDGDKTFKCQTGDCGSGRVDCAGAGAATPATLAEFTLDGSGGLDFYDVSLVDGYNLPMLVSPHGGTGDNCTSTGCVTDLNGSCPSDLRVVVATTTSDEGTGTGTGDTVACKSACDAFNQPQYCCSGSYGTPDTCKPSTYSMAFKQACPRAYSYAYDDKTSTFTCAGSPDYTVSFCPSPTTSQKATSSSQGQTNGSDPYLNSSMVYMGAMDLPNSGSTSSMSYTWTHVITAASLLYISLYN